MLGSTRDTPFTLLEYIIKPPVKPPWTIVGGPRGSLWQEKQKKTSDSNCRQLHGDHADTN